MTSSSRKMGQVLELDEWDLAQFTQKDGFKHGTLMATTGYYL
jgi:hypothetical protein